MATDIRLLRAIQAELASHAAAREQHYRQVDPGQLARSLPGFAEISAPVLVAAMGRPGRFRDGTKFKSYVGLAPRASQTGETDRKGQPMRFGIVREGEMRRRAKALLTEFGLDIDVAAPLGNYSVAIQHVTAIARAVDLSARVLILDEPTASLDRHEVEILFRIMRQLAKRGIGIVFVSHFLD